MSHPHPSSGKTRPYSSKTIPRLPPQRSTCAATNSTKLNRQRTLQTTLTQHLLTIVWQMLLVRYLRRPINQCRTRMMKSRRQIFNLLESDWEKTFQTIAPASRRLKRQQSAMKRRSATNPALGCSQGPSAKIILNNQPVWYLKMQRTSWSSEQKPN